MSLADEPAVSSTRLPSADTIELRAAGFGDSLEVARLLCIAGGGLYEFLFDDVMVFMTAREFLAAGVAGEETPISHRNCVVAVAPDGKLVGLANAFPADLLKRDSYPLVPRDRLERIGPMLRLQDWGSMFLNALAVDAGARGAGVGSRLLDWACDHARAGGFDRLSLHVWADNGPARAFYRARGFVERGVAEVELHARLAHHGGSVLMSLALTSGR